MQIAVLLGPKVQRRDRLLKAHCLNPFPPQTQVLVLVLFVSGDRLHFAYSNYDQLKFQPGSALLVIAESAPLGSVLLNLLDCSSMPSAQQGICAAEAEDQRYGLTCCKS